MSQATPEEPRGQDADELAQRIAGGSGLRRNDEGNIDVLASVGGIRGLIEALAPGLVFLGVYIGTQSLNPSLIASVAVAVVAFVARLVTKQNVVPAISGLIGIIICAIFARVGGHAKDYYVPGFWINAAYILGMAASAFAKWPLIGVIFGVLRGEETAWRKDPRRMRAYSVATWFVVGVFVLRLAVQLPLYWADEVTALGTARLVMGTPLYIGAIALAWMLTGPRTVDHQPLPRQPQAGEEATPPEGDQRESN
ncbi:MAG: DUF3159 domain-containing protein [Galactobacter sp.]